jgi:hypothetical protein
MQENKSARPENYEMLTREHFLDPYMHVGLLYVYIKI